MPRRKPDLKGPRQMAPVVVQRLKTTVCERESPRNIMNSSLLKTSVDTAIDFYPRNYIYIPSFLCSSPLPGPSFSGVNDIRYVSQAVLLLASGETKSTRRSTRQKREKIDGALTDESRQTSRRYLSGSPPRQEKSSELCTIKRLHL